MFCKQCGKELPDDQRFCGYCGADQQVQAPQADPQPEVQPEPQAQPEAQAPAGGTPSINLPGSTLTLILKIFAGVCALVYAIYAIGDLIGIFTGLIGAFNTMGYSFFAGFMSLLTGPLFAVLYTLLFACMCVLMLTFVLRKDEEKASSDSLFLGLALGGALTVVLAVVRMILVLLSALFFGYRVSGWSAILFKPILGAVIAVGGVFLILYLLGAAPALIKSLDELKAGLPGIFDVVRNVFAAFKSDTAAKKAANQQAQQAQAAAQYQQAQASQQAKADPNCPPSPPPARALKTDRGLVAYILLNIITCGIYGYYFLYTMARDVNIACSGDGKKTGGLIAFILLSYVTCGFYALYWYYSLGNRLAANAPRYGLTFQENGTTVLLWYLVGALLCGIGPYVAMHFLIKNCNALCSAYNHANGLYN